MTGTAPTENPLFRLYQRFNASLIAGDTMTLRTCVNAAGFVAQLPDLSPMDLDAFAGYVGRLRGHSPDFGDNVNILDVRERDGDLVVLYTDTFTFNGKLVTHTATDWVAIEDGRISYIDVLFDRTANQLKAFGMAIPTPK